MEIGSAILKKFTIVGLHGYKNVSVEFDANARIVVAENGSGKTTVFNALNAVVSRRFQRLKGISFQSIAIEFFGNSKTIELRKDWLGLGGETAFELASSITSRSSIDAGELVDFIQTNYVKGHYQRFTRHPLVHRIYLNSPHDHDELAEQFDELFDALDSASTSEAKEAKEAIADAFKDVEIVYLPTYRRIELPLMRASRRPGQSARNRLARAERGRHGIGGLDAHNINFGLADVEETLASLTEEIERRSNFEYRNISATILDEILRDQVEKEGTSGEELPDIESLSRFLSRVREDSAAKTLEPIRRLYETKEINSASKLWLRYFLGRLNRVISRTREIELKLERFVEVSNQYLKSSSDEKELAYDPQTMRVVVKNSWTDVEIALDDLSSGEKQVVSLMAKLYLSDAKKFVMIDEPELSLSIDWQMKILPDVMRSGSVIQLLAITHSPFVFDNELNGLAGPFQVERVRQDRQV